MERRDAPVLLVDADIARVAPETVVAAMRVAIRAHAHGKLAAPARIRTPLGDGTIVITAGGVVGQAVGLRAYGRSAGLGDDQMVAVWQDGAVTVVTVGQLLGVRRTAGIGAVATDVMARSDASTIGLVGAGPQAIGHVREVRAVRDLQLVQVFSRTGQRRQDAAQLIQEQLGIEARPVATPEQAAQGADLLLIGTRSDEPVIDPDAVQPGTHVTTIGPKYIGRHELPVAIAERARIIATDSLAQIDAYDPPFFLTGRPERDRMVELGALLDADVVRQDDADITLFCSVGLAGTEPLLAAALRDALAT